MLAVCGWDLRQLERCVAWGSRLLEALLRIAKLKIRCTMILVVWLRLAHCNGEAGDGLPTRKLRIDVTVTER